MCAMPPWARLLTSGPPFVPKHVFFPASTVFVFSCVSPYLFIFLFLASHHVFFPVSIQFALQFYLFTISCSILSCLCLPWKRTCFSPSSTHLESISSFPADALVPSLVPLSDPLEARWSMHVQVALFCSTAYGFSKAPDPFQAKSKLLPVVWDALHKLPL